MSDKIRAVIDAMTARVFAYQPKDKGKWAESVKAKIVNGQGDDRKSSI